MSTHRKPAAVPIRRAAPTLIPATITVWVTLPEMRPIITLTTAVIAAMSIYTWTQTRPWGPRARTAAHAASRALSWGLSGDTLTVVRIDRLGRSLTDLVSTLDDLAARGVHFRSLTEGIDTSTPLGRMFYQLAAAFAEYERALIRERTCAGIDAARAAGRRIGRPPALTDEQRTLARRLRDQGEGVAAIARILKVSPSTVRRTVNDTR